MQHGKISVYFVFPLQWRVKQKQQLTYFLPKVTDTVPLETFSKLKTILVLSLKYFSHFPTLKVRSPGMWCPKDRGSMDLWNSGILPQHYMASQCRRPWFESSLLWIPQNMHSPTCHQGGYRTTLGEFKYVSILDTQLTEALFFYQSEHFCQSLLMMGAKPWGIFWHPYNCSLSIHKDQFCWLNS
jgi:hypothetical protein